MAIDESKLAPEYELMLQQALQRLGQKRSVAEAQSIGESQRRGGVGSDIEFGLRRKAIEPYAQAEADTTAQILGDWFGKRREERLLGEERGYRTGEREATQRYGTGEREASQLWRGGESEKDRTAAAEARKFAAIGEGYMDPNTGEWYSEEVEPGRKLWGGELSAYRQNVHERGMQPKSKNKKWYQSLAEGIAPAAGTAIGWGLGGPVGGMIGGQLAGSFAGGGRAQSPTISYGGQRVRTSQPPRRGGGWYNSYMG